MLKWLLVVLVALGSLVVTYSFWISRPLFTERLGEKISGIAPREVALTFARTSSKLLLVTAHDRESVSGLDLTDRFGDAAADLILLYRELGYEALAALEGETTTVALQDLEQTHDYVGPFVAVGTNYAEHAEEVYLDDPPFLFPKLASPTAWNAPVRYTARLDYEAELCAVPLAEIASADDAVEFGLVLCNDFTDRWTLLSELDLASPMGSTGFAAGKGKASYLPTGYLFLIPRSPDLLERIELELAVNQEVRQRFVTDTMILKLPDIVSEAFRLADREFYRGEELVHLLPGGSIPRGTLILTGTAAGVIFKPLNIWNQRFYLDPGDLVVTRGTWLGTLANRINHAQ